MELYILRHGIAEDLSPAGTDRDRRLTPEGIERSEAAGKALKKLGVLPELILASPLVRARDTARIVAEQIGASKNLVECAALASGAGVPGIIAELRKVAKNHASVLLAGHEPELSELISTLLSGSAAVAVNMKKGAVCKLECISPEPGAARLEWLLTSKHLCRMA